MSNPIIIAVGREHEVINFSPSLSLSKIKQRASAREVGDINYWKTLSHDLIGEDDPLEKGARDAKG